MMFLLRRDRMKGHQTVYRLLRKAGMLPALPWAFGVALITTALLSEPVRRDLLIGGVLALLSGCIFAAGVISSRVIVGNGILDVRDYGVRKQVKFINLTRVYTVPSTFSTILAFEDDVAGTAIVYLGYWRDEEKMLADMAESVRTAGVPCSGCAARLLGTEIAEGVADSNRTSLLEAALGFGWIAFSTVIPFLLGRLLA
jgi:hypothetical protein